VAKIDRITSLRMLRVNVSVCSVPLSPPKVAKNLSPLTCGVVPPAETVYIENGDSRRLAPSRKPLYQRLVLLYGVSERKRKSSGGGLLPALCL